MLNEYQTRRKYDDNPVKRLWEQLTPLPHIIGAVALGALTIGYYRAEFEAQAQTIREQSSVIEEHAKRLNNVETTETRIDQKLDDIIFYWHIPHATRP